MTITDSTATCGSNEAQYAPTERDSNSFGSHSSPSGKSAPPSDSAGIGATPSIGEPLNDDAAPSIGEPFSVDAPPSIPSGAPSGSSSSKDTASIFNRSEPVALLPEGPSAGGLFEI